MPPQTQTRKLELYDNTKSHCKTSKNTCKKMLNYNFFCKTIKLFLRLYMFHYRTIKQENWTHTHKSVTFFNNINQRNIFCIIVAIKNINIHKCENKWVTQNRRKTLIFLWKDSILRMILGKSSKRSSCDSFSASSALMMKTAWTLRHSCLINKPRYNLIILIFVKLCSAEAAVNCEIQYVEMWIGLLKMVKWRKMWNNIGN